MDPPDLPWGRLPKDGAHEATLVWWPMEFSGSWGTTAEESLVNWEVRTPSVSVSRLLPVWVFGVCQGTCWQAEAIPERTTHKCVLLGQGTKALSWQSKKTKWEDLMGGAVQSDWGWATSLWLGWCPDCNPRKLSVPILPRSSVSQWSPVLPSASSLSLPPYSNVNMCLAGDHTDDHKPYDIFFLMTKCSRDAILKMRRL